MIHEWQKISRNRHKNSRLDSLDYLPHQRQGIFLIYRLVSSCTKNVHLLNDFATIFHRAEYQGTGFFFHKLLYVHHILIKNMKELSLAPTAFNLVSLNTNSLENWIDAKKPGHYLLF